MRGCDRIHRLDESADSGEMPERPKGVDSKSTVSLWHRGFESLSLRHFMKKFVNVLSNIDKPFSGQSSMGLLRDLSRHTALPMAIGFLGGAGMAIETKVPGKEPGVVSPEFRAN